MCKSKDVRNEVLGEFPQFKWIEDIANAYKHFERNRGRAGLSVTRIVDDASPKRLPPRQMNEV
jgi:hypothetical protein